MVGIRVLVSFQFCQFNTLFKIQWVENYSILFNEDVSIHELKSVPEVTEWIHSQTVVRRRSSLSSWLGGTEFWLYVCLCELFLLPPLLFASAGLAQAAQDAGWSQQEERRGHQHDDTDANQDAHHLPRGQGSHTRMHKRTHTNTHTHRIKGHPTLCVIDSQREDAACCHGAVLDKWECCRHMNSRWDTS